jgi:hypothetical protein
MPISNSYARWMRGRFHVDLQPARKDDLTVGLAIVTLSSAGMQIKFVRSRMTRPQPYRFPVKVMILAES